MRLLLRRRQRPAVFGGRVVLGLDLRAEFSPAEQAYMRRHRLAGTILYQRGDLTDPGFGLLGVGYRAVFHLTNLTVRVKQLIGGCRIECRDFVEMAAIEAQIVASAHVFGEVLRAANDRIGEEVVEA